ncbi:MAG: hypothetical protein J6W88_01785 [Bacteroidales bacterium]|nr:hypothetical protein [Bacteroidales bacterium]
MKKTLLLLAAAMLLTSVSAVAQNKIDKQGRRQGHWIRTDKDGSKIYEGDFVDGLETGTFTYFYPDGTVRMRNIYTEPGVRCNHEAYDQKGQLMARGQYDRRNRDGRWEFFDEEGHRVKEATYSMGVKQGLHVVYNHKGDTAEVTNWVDNHRNGRWWKRMGENGYITANYVQGGVEGRLVQYDDNGLLVREGYYKNGLKHGSNKLYENGQLAVEERWDHGTLADRRIRLLLPQEEFVSIYDMACLAPQGKSKTVVVLNDGTKLVSNESAEVVYDRLGNEYFDCANRKGRIMVSRRAVQGVGKDAEGRDILLMEPQPDFAIFPDEDGLKMIRSRKYDDDSPLDHLRHE